MGQSQLRKPVKMHAVCTLAYASMLFQGDGGPSRIWTGGHPIMSRTLYLAKL